MRTTAIMNLKGGTGKTVTAINAAAILARFYGQRVLLVDTDSQGNLTEFVTSLLPDDEQVTANGVSALLTGSPSFYRKTSLDNVWILPGSDDLMDLDLSKAESGAVDVDALRRLKPHLEPRFDWVLIDCPPAFNAAAIAALLAADEVVVPMKLDAFGIRGMSNLLRQVKNMRKLNPGLLIAGILPTMYYPSQQMKDAEASLRQSGLPCFHHIRRSTMVDDSTFAQLPLVKSSPKSGACHDYKLFVRDLMEGGAQYGL